MGEKASLNLGKRYWLTVLEGKSYTCTNTKKLPWLCPVSMINGLGFFLSFYCCISSTSLFSFSLSFSLLFIPFFCYIPWFLCHIHYPRVSQELGASLVPSRTSLNLLLLAVRLLVYCSGITSTLMRPES